MPAPAHTDFDIALIEDSTVLRDLLSAMLADIPNIRLVGAAASEAEGLKLLQATRPRLVIVDLELREGTGLRVLAALQRHPDHFGTPQAVVFSNHAHSVVQARCRMLGARAFFDKSFQTDDLLAFIEDAAGCPATASH